MRGDELLLVRVRGNEHWYLPGGKIEAAESPQAALQRELKEELGIDLEPGSVRYLYTVVGPSYGESRALGEISEVAWIDRRETPKFAPAVRLLCAQQLSAG